MTVLQKTALGLVIVGALNWLLVGAFSFDLVAGIFGAHSLLSRVVYVLVGVAGLICIPALFAPASRSAAADSRNLRRAS